MLIVAILILVALILVLLALIALYFKPARSQPFVIVNRAPESVTVEVLPEPPPPEPEPEIDLSLLTPKERMLRLQPTRDHLGTGGSFASVVGFHNKV